MCASMQGMEELFCTHLWMNHVHMYACTDGWMIGSMDGLMHVWVDALMS